jgi:hypothetical protein
MKKTPFTANVNEDKYIKKIQLHRPDISLYSKQKAEGSETAAST